MRVLVIHDRAEVAEQICVIVREELGAGSDVKSVVDLVSARDLFRAYSYDLAVVDLTVPWFKGHEADLKNVVTLLTDLYAGGDLRPPADVVGISRDTDVVHGVRTSVGEHVLGLIKEDVGGAWREKLREKVRYVDRARRGRLLAACSSYDYDIAVVTALDSEFSPYHELLELSRCDSFPNAYEFLLGAGGGEPLRGVAVSAGRSGQAPTASLAQAVLCRFRPRVVVMSGFCGGVKARMALGDVALFASVAHWDYGKYVDSESGSSFLARPDPLNIAVSVRDRLRDVENHRFAPAELRAVGGRLTQAELNPKVRLVAAASGSAVVATENVLSAIVGLNENIYALDMESYAFYYACLNTPVLSPSFVCIKGVADHCDGNKNSVWHGGCSYLSAVLALHVARRLVP